MNHTVDYEGWVFVSGWLTCFDTPTLINCNVDHDGSLLHFRDHVSRHKFRSFCPRNENRPNDKIGVDDGFFDILRVGENRIHFILE